MKNPRKTNKRFRRWAARNELNLAMEDPEVTPKTTTFEYFETEACWLAWNAGYRTGTKDKKGE